MIRIIGDINFADGYFDQGIGIGSSIKNGADPFKHLDRSADDFWIGNFECTCADVEESFFPFAISPSVLRSIEHLNLYGVANNHVMQAGVDGFSQTLKFLHVNNIAYAGADNHRSVKFEHQGKCIGFVAFSMRPDNFTDNPLYWHLPELKDVQDELDKLSDCDFKIVFIHWGYEFINRPNIEQRQMARWLIESGADLVVGMHPHVAQGAEVYKGKHIFYSLGNAVFNMAWEPTRYGLMLNVDLSAETPKVWSDYVYIGDDHFPTVVQSVPKPFTRECLDSLIGVNTENEKYFSEARRRNAEYTKANRKAILKSVLSMPVKAQKMMILDFVKRRFLHK